jgi:hypothetical protein
VDPKEKEINELPEAIQKRLGSVAHTCNASYLGDGYWEDHGWKPVQAKC